MLQDSANHAHCLEESSWPTGGLTPLHSCLWTCTHQYYLPHVPKRIITLRTFSAWGGGPSPRAEVVFLPHSNVAVSGLLSQDTLLCPLHPPEE